MAGAWQQQSPGAAPTDCCYIQRLVNINMCNCTVQQLTCVPDLVQFKFKGVSKGVVKSD